jgi:hypothetical protein
MSRWLGLLAQPMAKNGWGWPTSSVQHGAGVMQSGADQRVGGRIGPGGGIQRRRRRAVASRDSGRVLKALWEKKDDEARLNLNKERPMRCDQILSRGSWLWCLELVERSWGLK